MTATNYDGRDFTMDSFTAQTTDGSGNITVTLAHTPYADQSIVVSMQGVAGAYAQFSSRTGAAVTFKVYGTYDRTDTTVGGTVTGLPTGVTTDTSSSGPSFTTSTGSTTSNYASNGGATVSKSDHTHSIQVSKISNHNHSNTATVLNTLNTTSGITLIVAYAF